MDELSIIIRVLTRNLSTAVYELEDLLESYGGTTHTMGCVARASYVRCVQHMDYYWAELDSKLEEASNMPGYDSELVEELAGKAYEQIKRALPIYQQWAAINA